MDVVEQMRTLIAVADAGSFTKAGRVLGKSKALVSKHVADLEERLGARLLNRTTRQVSVTESGAAYVQRARELVSELDALDESVKNNSGRPQGTLRLTAPQAFGELELMQMICGFQEAYPDVTPDVFLSDRVVDIVAEGFDMAIRVTAMPDSALIARKLAPAALGLCAAPAYLTKHGAPSAPAELANHACIHDTNMGVRPVWRFRNLETGDQASVTIRPVLTINSAIAVRQAVVSGRGIAICPDFAVAREIAYGSLVEVLPEWASNELALHILYPHRLHLSAKARAFIDFAVNWYAGTPPWLRVSGA